MKWQENFSVQQVLNINWFQFPLWYETYNSSNFKNYWHIFFQRNYRLTCWNCFAAAPLVDSMPINKLQLSMDNIGNETFYRLHFCGYEFLCAKSLGNHVRRNKKIFQMCDRAEFYSLQQATSFAQIASMTNKFCDFLRFQNWILHKYVVLRSWLELGKNINST